MDISGTCAADLAGVERAFQQGFELGRDVGAAVAVVHHGELVVDLWAGHRDRRKTQPWQQDTLACFFSVSKAVTALCVLQAVDQGALDLDAPVADVWPEYAAAGKSATTLRDLFAHRAGLPGLRKPVERDAYYDWEAMCAALAAETPWWTPGEAHGYHARTFGFLLGEVLKRATGVPVDDWLRDRIATPRGLDIHFGLSEADQVRCADMLPAKVRIGEQKSRPPVMQAMLADFNRLDTPTGAAFQNPSLGAGYMNSARFRAAVIPAVNGHGTARDVARLLSQIPALLSEELLGDALRTHSQGPDQVLKSSTRFGLGFMLYEDESPIGRPGCFGHAGAGGSVAFYDPARDLAFAFVMNQMQEGVVTGGTSATACADAVYAALDDG